VSTAKFILAQNTQVDKNVFELAREISIEDVIRHFYPSLSLRRSGRELVALCPFHQEKTPSFSVNPEKNFFHCFGCGAGGDAIDFVAELLKISRREAASEICNAFGLTPVQVSPVARRKTQAQITQRKREQALEKAFDAWRNATIRGLGVLERACQRVIREGPGNPAFEIACQYEPQVGYLLDVLLYGTREEQIQIYQKVGFKWALN